MGIHGSRLISCTICVKVLGIKVLWFMKTVKVLTQNICVSQLKLLAWNMMLQMQKFPLIMLSDYVTLIWSSSPSKLFVYIYGIPITSWLLSRTTAFVYSVIQLPVCFIPCIVWVHTLVTHAPEYLKFQGVQGMMIQLV